MAEVSVQSSKTQKSGTDRKKTVSSRSGADYSQALDSPVKQILYLQKTIGNRAVTHLFQSGAIQARLKIGKPNDIYEKEADRVSERVMRMRDESLVNGHSSLGRKEGPEEEKEETPVFTKSAAGSTPEVTPNIESSINTMKGGGQPLSESTRSFFEPRFGADFSNVRVHTDSRAANTAQAINAKAFTTGKDIVFNSGQYSPGTSSGKRLLAHELTHVVQQMRKGDQIVQNRLSINCCIVQCDVANLDPNCKSLLEKIYRFIFERKPPGKFKGLIQRFEELKNDPHNLQFSHWTKPHPRYGSIEGHQKQFKEIRDKLRKLLEKWKDDNCYGSGFKLPQEVWNWARKPVPKPIPKAKPILTPDMKKQIFEWIKEVTKTGEDAYESARKFLRKHEEILTALAVLLAITAIVILVATIIEDIATLGAGIADDPASFSAAWALLKVAWEMAK